MNFAADMHPALQRRLQEQEQLIDVARRYARRLAERLAVRWAVVAGSVARGDFHDGSDIDVLVVSDALPPEPLRRGEMLFGVAFGGVEPKGLTSEEVRRELERRNPLVLEALTRGVVVYPDGVSLEQVRREVCISDPDCDPGRRPPGQRKTMMETAPSGAGSPLTRGRRATRPRERSSGSVSAFNSSGNGSGSSGTGWLPPGVRNRAMTIVGRRLSVERRAGGLPEGEAGRPAGAGSGGTPGSAPAAAGGTIDRP